MLPNTSVKLQKIKWRILHVFVFHHPNVVFFEYEKIVLSKNGYLLLYWKSSEHSYLEIPILNKCIFQKQGLALIQLPDTDDITIKIRNNWHKQIFILSLSRIDVRIEKPKETITMFKDFKAAINIATSFKEFKSDVFLFATNDQKLLLNQFTFSIHETFNLLNQAS